jgi:Flp pilus assembly pilin Flp
MMRLPNEKGQGLVEYALILVLVTVVVIAILALLGPPIDDLFGRINRAVAEAEMCGSTLSANDDSATTPQNTSVTIAVLTNDDLGSCRDLATTALSDSPSYGIVSRNADNTFTYQPFTDFVGQDQFEYLLCLNACGDYNERALVTITVEPPPPNDAPLAATEVLATNETSSTAEQAIENYLAFKTLALAQQDQVDQAQLILAQDTLLTGFVDVLTDLAAETEDTDLLQALDQVRQVIQDGNYEALPDAFTTLGESLPNLPLALQTTMMQAMGPGLANACQPIKAGQVSLTAADEALQLFAQLEAEQPGSTGEVIPLLTDARNQVETRNQIFAAISNNITTGGEFVAAALETFGEVDAAQQLRTYTQICEGVDSANNLTPTVSGTAGNNGWYTSDVTVSWPLQSDWGVVSGCQTTLIDFDTLGRDLSCLVVTADGQIRGGQVTIKRDATPPALELLQPVFPLNVPEGSSVTFDATAQDNLSQPTLLWDADNDGIYESPNPVILSVPGNLAGWVVPTMVVAIDEAGNETHLMLPTDQVSIINLPPNLEGMTLSADEIPFGDTVQLEATTSDPGDDPLSAVVEWGDGSSDPVTVNGDGSLQAEHTYIQAGPFEIRLQVNDGDSGSDEGTTGVIVWPESQSVQITIDDVTGYVNGGLLTQQQGGQLIKPLQRAKRHFEAGRVWPTLGGLHRYITQRDHFIEGGVLQIDEVVAPTFYIPDAIVAATSTNLPPPAMPLSGALNEPATAAIPDKGLTPREQDYRDDYPGLEGIYLSFNTLFLVFELDTTVAQANIILNQIEAEIVGGLQGVAGQTEGILIVRVPTESHLEMIAIIEELKQNPKVKLAVQDVLLEPLMIPGPTSDIEYSIRCNEDTDEDNFEWTWTRGPAGSNWGLERIRVPQMWNLNVAVEKAGGTAEVGIIDIGFADRHPDLNYVTNLTPGEEAAHGTHVAGIIGATFNNGIGPDGINPFAQLKVVAPRMRSPSSDLSREASYGYMWSKWFVELVTTLPNLKVVNLSLGYNWGPLGHNSSTNTTLQRIVNDHGALFTIAEFTLLGRGFDLPVVVAGAGNDSWLRYGLGLQEARYASPYNNAALHHNVANIIVVESVRSTDGAARSAFSNINGHVSAPGEDILSTWVLFTSSGPKYNYETCSGTSMATPHVTGLVSYLYSIDPSLPNPTIASNPIRDLLQANGVPVADNAQVRIDAFATVMDIDRLQNNDRVRRMLLDIDDGTPDGNQRLEPGTGTDYTVEDADDDGGPGDGQIDMADFRRWRDWLLQVENSPALSLDGSLNHPKKDVNGNGSVETPSDENLYPRGDFNGDGLLSRTSLSYVPGRVDGMMTDLEVLQSLFNDPDYDASQLPGLIDSADVEVWPINCLGLDGVTRVRSSLQKSSSSEPEWMRDHTPGAPRHIYTVRPGSYIARVDALDSAGNVVTSVEQNFTFDLGSDTFWNPLCGTASNTPPSVIITNPPADTGTQEPGFLIDGYDPDEKKWFKDVLLEAEATDAEDGLLTGDAVLWSTDRSDLHEDPNLGSGSSLLTRLYSDVCSGTWHQIKVTVTDSDGNVQTDIRNIFIWGLC